MTIGQNLNDIQSLIDRALNDASRPANATQLVAVTKTKPAEDVQTALEAGHRVFGENRVQEAQEKFPDLKTAYPDLELHLIGPLQSNKTRDAVALFDVIQTVDRPKLIRHLVKAMAELDRKVACLIQVNTGSEPQKAGVEPQDLPDLLSTAKEEGLDVAGLMCIPPADQPAQPHFAFLAKLAQENGLVDGILSMGMSGDFEQATRLGATHVRVGSAIFGGRPPLKPSPNKP